MVIPWLPGNCPAKYFFPGGVPYSSKIWLIYQDVIDDFWVCRELVMGEIFLRQWGAARAAKKFGKISPGHLRGLHRAG